MPPAAIDVRSVSKRYTLADSQWARLRAIFGVAPRPESSVLALDDVSFSVAPGEAFGIVGSNGSGKSTLLKIAAGILRPTSGSIELAGRCAALLELGSGFSPEFTGRQNVAMSAAVLGLPGEVVRERFESIHRFSGIGDFIDQPIRTYSSGMVMRLAFAVAAHSDPKILIVDEALAVGDVSFRQRCLRRIHQLRAEGVTILFVSHDSGDVKALCERCLWLDRGRIKAIGEADEVVAAYLVTTLDRRAALPSPTPASDGHPHAIADPVPGKHRFGNGAASVSGVSFPAVAFPDRETILRLRVCGNRHVPELIVGFLVRNEKGETIFGSNTARENHPLAELKTGEERVVSFLISMPRLAPGAYSISVAVSAGTLEDFDVCDYIEDAVSFKVEPGLHEIEGYLEIPLRGVTVHRH